MSEKITRRGFAAMAAAALSGFGAFRGRKNNPTTEAEAAVEIDAQPPWVSLWKAIPDETERRSPEFGGVRVRLYSYRELTDEDFPGYARTQAKWTGAKIERLRGNGYATSRVSIAREFGSLGLSVEFPRCTRSATINPSEWIAQFHMGAPDGPVGWWPIPIQTPGWMVIMPDETFMANVSIDIEEPWG